ncbi:MAG TPA: diguanylate cyclase [Pyrinomonadaceae bacterium]|nr:diguanylate cyclase [Pyrinomonadaceae bacterium]
MRILIAEDDSISSRILTKMLSKWGHEVIITRDGLEAWQVLRGTDAPPLAILDWMMPEMDGIEVCRKVRGEMTDTPPYLILLTAKSRREDLIEGLEAGADDFITKPFDAQELRVRLQAGARIIELQSSLAERVLELEGAIGELKRAEAQLRSLALTDDMTGLYNHRGFFNLVAHHFKGARRTGASSLIFYFDLDGLKRINDTYGHQEGSRAIAATAQVLRETFRESDIIGRLGGDEFAVLAANASAAGINELTARLWENLRLYNEQDILKHPLSLSLGVICVAADSSSPIEELIARADAAMYEHKQSKREPPPVLGAGSIARPLQPSHAPA